MNEKTHLQWPDISVIENITVTPLLGPNSKRILSIAASPCASELQHFRAGRKEGAIDILPFSGSIQSLSVIEEPTIFGGLLFRHFGHAIAESIHRLWPRLAFTTFRRAKVAFIPVNHAKVMPYVTQALNLHGIRGRDIIRIEEPVAFKTLIVAPQARQMAGPTLVPGYRALLDTNLSRRLPEPTGSRRLYISRSGHQHTGSFQGEDLVEDALAAHGFEIVHPEKHSLRELLTMLRASEIAVFAEGSALHALELCGSRTPSVFVIGRRRGSSKRFRLLLSDVCDRWMISERVISSFGNSENPKKNSGIVDLEQVFSDLEGFLGVDLSRST